MNNPCISLDSIDLAVAELERYCQDSDSDRLSDSDSDDDEDLDSLVLSCHSELTVRIQDLWDLVAELSPGQVDLELVEWYSGMLRRLFELTESGIRNSAVIGWNAEVLSRVPELRSLVTRLGGQPITEAIDWFPVIEEWNRELADRNAEEDDAHNLEELEFMEDNENTAPEL